MREPNNSFNKPRSDWGGPWTQKKLEAFSKYVRSYLTIMKNFPFWETIYFDGFAGSGSRKKYTETEIYKQLQITEEEEQVYLGSAERVLQLPDDLRFNFYYFVDANEKSLENLKGKLGELPEAKDKKLVFKPGDANKWLVELGNALKTKNYVALVFLDPFGMQINWESIASLKGTRSDVWILVPTGVIVNRLLDKGGKLTHLEKLQSFFGLNEDEIRKRFYKTNTSVSLFGEEREIVTKVSEPIQQISNLYIERLKTVWDHVTEIPLRLDNTRGIPIFHFVFASNNKNALKIAKDIIKLT